MTPQRLIFGLLLFWGFAGPNVADAGYFFGDWSWCWHQDRDCPKGEYCPLHYWVPEYYKLRACVHPSNVDQYPPGPTPPVMPTFELNHFRCRAIPPAPSRPYADPVGYFGREVTNPR